MKIFEGVHGTSAAKAKKICSSGFVIPDIENGMSMYGRGIYFFENYDIGIKSAIMWARNNRHDTSEATCVIFVDISYYEEDAYFFDRQLFEEYLNKKQMIVGMKFNPQQKNRLRAAFIKKELSILGVAGKIIFTTYFLDLSTKYRDVKGCVVKDSTLIPNHDSFRTRPNILN